MEERKLQNNKGRMTAEWLYAALVGFLMISYLIRLAHYAEPYDTPVWLEALRMIAVALGLTLGKLWRDKGFRILMVFLSLLFFRVALEDASRLFEFSVSEALLNAVWAFVGCYGVARSLGKKRFFTFLKILGFVWTLGMTVHAGIAVYAAWRGKVIMTIGGGGFWGLGGTIGGGDFHYLLQNAVYTGSYKRLYAPIYVTTSGSMLSLSVVIAAFELIVIRRKWPKPFLALCALVLYVAMTLTDSRAAHVTTAVGVAILAFGLSMHIFHRRWAQGKWTERNIMAWIASTVCMAVVFVAMIFTAGKTIDVFNQVKADGGVLIRQAQADSVGEDNPTTAEKKTTATISNRGFNGNDVLTDRPRIWKNAIQYLMENPITLLIGDSLYYPMNGPNTMKSAPFPAGHCHSMPLQLILACGIPGLLTVLVFMVYVAWRAVRLVNRKTSALWQMLLAAPIVCVAVGELVECFTKLCYPWAILPLMFLFCGAVSAMGDQEITAPLPAQETGSQH